MSYLKLRQFEYSLLGRVKFSGLITLKLDLSTNRLCIIIPRSLNLKQRYQTPEAYSD